MKRGSIVLFREPGSPASKSRPCVIVQHVATLSDTTKITAVPLTSHLSGRASQRPVLVPTERNGLRQASEAQTDWVFTFRVERLGPTIGEAETEIMPEIDNGLRLWLDL